MGWGGAEGEGDQAECGRGGQDKGQKAAGGPGMCARAAQSPRQAGIATSLRKKIMISAWLQRGIFLVNSEVISHTRRLPLGGLSAGSWLRADLVRSVIAESCHPLTSKQSR